VGILKAMMVFLRAMLTAKVHMAVENLALRQQLAVCGQSVMRGPPDAVGLVHNMESGSSCRQAGSHDQVGELTYVDINTSWLGPPSIFHHQVAAWRWCAQAIKKPGLRHDGPQGNPKLPKCRL
jgi:hypothetical protein